MPTTSSQNYTGLYSNDASSVSPGGAYGNANVVSLLATSTDGANTIGNISATGNVTAANFIGNVIGNITGNIVVPGSNTQVLYNNNGNLGASAGLVFDSATNAVSVTGTVSATGNITGSYFLGNGSQLTGLPATYSNANVTTLLAAFGSNTISTTGNVTAGYFLGNGSQLTGLAATYSNANVTTLLAAFGSNSISTTGNVTAAYFAGDGSQLTNINAGNIVGSYGNANVAAFLAAFGSNTISTTGSVTAGSVTATGNVVGGNITTGGLVSATGNVTGGNVSTAGQVTATGNVTGGNLITGGLITATGTITSSANVTGANVNTAGVVSATGNVTGGNLVTAGLLQAKDGLLSGNLTVGGNLVYVNVETLAVEDPIIELGRGPNGAPLTSNDGRDRGEQLWYYTTQEQSAFIGYDNSAGKLLAAANVSIANEVVTVNSLGSMVAGDLEVTTVSASGNVTGNYFLGNGSQLTGIASTYGNANVANFLANYGANTFSSTGNVTAGNVITPSVYTSNITGAAGQNVTVAADGTGDIHLDADSVRIGDNNIDATIVTHGTGDLILRTNEGDASQGNVRIYDGANGNIDLNPNGSGTVNITGTGGASVIGNVVGGNLRTAGVVSATGNVIGGNVVTGGYVSATGNVSSGNVYTTGIVTATGNITGGNVVSLGLISATGNVSGNYFIGNGSQLTGINPSTLQGNMTGNISGQNTYAITGLTHLSLANSSNIAIGSIKLTNNAVSPPGLNIDGSLEVSGLTAFNGDVTIQDGNGVNFLDSDNSNYVGLKAPAVVASNIEFTLPGTDGTSNQVLKTNGSGVLSFGGLEGSMSGNITGNNTYAITGLEQITVKSLGNIAIGNSKIINNSASPSSLVIDTALSVDGTLTASNGNIHIEEARGVRWYDTDNTNYVAIQGPGTVTSDVTWTLPATDGTSGQSLNTYGNGILYWSTGSTTNNITATDDTVTTTLYPVMVAAAGSSQTANVTTSRFTFNAATGALSASGNITGANIVTAGITTATGNITGGNLITLGQVTATANVTGANVVATANLTSTQQTIVGTANVGTTGNIVISGKNIATDMVRNPDSATSTTAETARIFVGTGNVGNVQPQSMGGATGARLLVSDYYQRGNNALTAQAFGTSDFIQLSANVSNGSWRQRGQVNILTVGGGANAYNITQTSMTAGPTGSGAAINIGGGTAASTSFLGNTSVSHALGAGYFISTNVNSSLGNAVGSLAFVTVTGNTTNYLGYTAGASGTGANLTNSITFYHAGLTNTYGTTMANVARNATNYYSFKSDDDIAQVGLGSLRSYHEFNYAAGNTSGAITINKTNGQVQQINLTGNVTSVAFSNFVTSASAGTTKEQMDTVTIVFNQGATGGYGVTLPTGSTYKYAGNVTTVGTTANSLTMVSVSALRVGGTTTYLLSVSPEFV
jgi:hypothetical protein